MADARFVWLDAMGVIFQSADDVRELLVPFARARGSRVAEDDAVAVYRARSSGRFSSAELWARLGVPGEASRLDEEHLAAHRLVPGIIDFARAAVRAGMRVGCVSNDVSEWARHLRSRHELDALITPWVSSGDVGARKPDRAIYDRLVELTGVAPALSVVVDDREANLDAASDLGFSTVRFGAGSARHRSATNAAELTALLVGSCS